MAGKQTIWLNSLTSRSLLSLILILTPHFGFWLTTIHLLSYVLFSHPNVFVVYTSFSGILTDHVSNIALDIVLQASREHMFSTEWSLRGIATRVTEDNNKYTASD